MKSWHRISGSRNRKGEGQTVVFTIPSRLCCYQVAIILLIIKSKSKQPNPSIASYYYDINIKNPAPTVSASQPASQPLTPALQQPAEESQLMKLWPDSAFTGTLLHLESPPPLWALPPWSLTSAQPPSGGPPYPSQGWAIPPLHTITVNPVPTPPLEH